MLFGPLHAQPQSPSLVVSMFSILSTPNLDYDVAGSIARVLEDILTVGGGKILAQNPSKFPPIFEGVLAVFAPIYIKVFPILNQQLVNFIVGWPIAIKRTCTRDYAINREGW
jgi:hypothetical protein